MGRSRALYLVIALVGLAACGEATGTPRATGPLFLRSSRGIAVVEAGASAPTFKMVSAVPSGDWATAVHTEPSGRSTRVVGTDAITGTDVWANVVPGFWRTKIVAQDG